MTAGDEPEPSFYPYRVVSPSASRVSFKREKGERRETWTQTLVPDASLLGLTQYKLRLDQR